MIWVTWRQLRARALVVGFAVLGIAAVAIVNGRHVAALAPVNGSRYDALQSIDRTLFWAGIVLVAALPALLGAFWGAPMVAGEVESETHLLAWNQSITRTRWLATKLTVTALAAAAAAAVVTLAVTWAAAPLDGATGNRTGGLPSRLTPVSFAMRGVVPVGYAVFAIALGATLGTVLRRTLPAMALTLAIVVALQVAVPAWVRLHLAPTVSDTVVLDRTTLDGISISNDSAGHPVRLTVHSANHGDWILENTTVDPDSRPTSLPDWVTECLPGPEPTVTRAEVSGDPVSDCLGRLTEAGYHQRLVYVPASQFWRLQWIETALHLALAGILSLVCGWWLRVRRT